MIVVDRIENGIAICELDNEFTQIPLESISGNVSEGVVLIKEDNKYIVDLERTDLRRKEIFEKQRKLFSK